MQSLWKWMCFIILFIRTTRSAIFTVSERENILNAELEVAKELRKFIVKEEARLEKMRRIIDELEKHSKETVIDVEGELANPVNNYLLVKRFTQDWDNLVDTVIRGNNTNEFLSDIATKTCYYPRRRDLLEMAADFFRLEDTYSLSVKDIADGNIQDLARTSAMSASDCFLLGRIAYDSQDYYHSIVWMQEALDRWTSDDEETAPKSSIFDYYSFATFSKSQTRILNSEIGSLITYSTIQNQFISQGNAVHALNLTKEWLQLEPDDVRAERNKRFLEEKITEEAEQRKKGQDDVPSLEFTNNRTAPPYDEYRRSNEYYEYEAMCRGDIPVKYKYAHKLTCQYRSWHPIHVINPLKEEVLYLDPFVGVYHDLITDKQIEKVKELAKPKLHRSGVFTWKDEDSLISSYRTSYRMTCHAMQSHERVCDNLPMDHPAATLHPHMSQFVIESAWIRDEEDREIRRISVKSGVLSNLTLESVEELQVLNYRIGGHYEPHFDFARENEKNTFELWRGNRIATVIYYMKDVISGGCTVFPTLGVRIVPEKGACGIWYNLHRNGDGDMRTKHASCPVLIGSKWVCNKWFHERGQEFTRLCDPNPEI